MRTVVSKHQSIKIGRRFCCKNFVIRCRRQCDSVRQSGMSMVEIGLVGRGGLPEIYLDDGDGGEYERSSRP